MRADSWRWFVRGSGVAVAFAVVAAVVLVLSIAVHALILVAIAILLAAGLEPAIGWLRGKTHLGRGTTIVLVYAAFFALVVILLFLVVPTAVSQLSALAERLPSLLAQLRSGVESVGPPPLGQGLARIVDALSANLGSPSSSGPDPNQLLGAGAAVADAAISAISILTLVFFWLTGHQRLQRFSLALLPAERRGGVREGWNEVENRLGLWVRGQLVLMGSIFLMTSVAYFVLGLEGALLLGLIAGIAEIVPIVGPALGAVPALVVAALSGRIELVVAVAIVYVIIQIIEGNVLVPVVMRHTIGVPPFLVVVSLLIGAAVGGILGALLAVPLAAALTVVLERVQARDEPVPLEGSSSDETPGRKGLDEMRHRSADDLKAPAPG